MSKTLKIITWIKEDWLSNWGKSHFIEKGKLLGIERINNGRQDNYSSDPIYSLKFTEKEDRKKFTKFFEENFSYQQDFRFSCMPLMEIEITEPEKFVKFDDDGLRRSGLEITGGVKEVKKWSGPQVFRFELLRKYPPYDGLYKNNSLVPEEIRNAHQLSIHFKDWNIASELDLGNKESKKNLPGAMRFNDYLVCYVSHLLITDKQKWESLEEGEEYILKVDWNKVKSFPHYLDMNFYYQGLLIDDENVSFEINTSEKLASGKICGFRNYGQIWDYNALYGFHHKYHKHSTLKEYDELFNKFQDHSPQNSNLYQTIQRKIIKPDNLRFRAVIDDDWDNKRKDIIENTKRRNEKELDKVAELVELLKQLFAKGEPKKNTPKRPQGEDLQAFRNWAILDIENDIKRESEKYVVSMQGNGYLSDWKKRIERAKDRTEVESIRGSILHEIESRKRSDEWEKKSKEENSNELNSSLNKAETTEDQKTQKEELEKIKNLYGTIEYKNQEEKINKLEEKVAENNTEDYKSLVQSNLVEEMKKWGLEENELTSEIKIKFEKLKRDSIINTKDFIKISHEVVENISLTGATKKLNNLISQAQQFLKEVKKQTQNKANQLIESLQNFDKVDSVFKQQVYQNQRNQIEELITNLQSSYPSQDTHSSLFRPEVVIPITLIVVLIAAFLLKLRKRKQ